MKKRVMIIEDDLATLTDLIKIVLSVLPDADIKAFQSMEMVYETALKHRIDLFMLDIIIDKSNSCDTSGIEFIDRMRTIPRYEFTPVIFITSLEDPKLYAYSQLHSFGYVEKPYDREYIKRITMQALRFPVAENRDSVLYFRNDGVLYAIRSSDILYIESVGRNVQIYKTDKSHMFVPYKSCKKILSDSGCEKLIQCNRNTIINIDYIENIDLSNKCIKLFGFNEVINIGRTFYKDFTSFLLY